MKKKDQTTLFLFVWIIQCVVAQPASVNQEIHKRPATQEEWREEVQQSVIQESSGVTFGPGPKIPFLEMSPKTKCEHLEYMNTLLRMINEVSMDSETKRGLSMVALNPGGETFHYNNRTYQYPLSAHYTSSYRESVKQCESQAIKKAVNNQQQNTLTRTNTYNQGSTNTTQKAAQELGQALGELAGVLIVAGIEKIRENKREKERLEAEKAAEEKARIGALEIQTQEELIGYSEYNSDPKLIAYNGSNAGNKSNSGLMQMPISGNNDNSKTENNSTLKLRPMLTDAPGTTNNVPAAVDLSSLITINPEYLNAFIYDLYNYRHDDYEALCERFTYWVDQDFKDKKGYFPNGGGQEDIHYYNELKQKYVDEVNKIVNENEQKWEKFLNKPEWEDMLNSIDNPQRFLAILNEAGRRNGTDKLPNIIASDESYYHLRLNQSKEILSIAKNGDNIVLSPHGDGWYEDFTLGGEKAKFLGLNEGEVSLKDAFIGGSSVQYNLKSDGSFLDYSFFDESSWTIGTKNSIKMDFVDMTYSTAPKLAVNGNIFYFQTSKFDVNAKVEAFGEIELPIEVVYSSDGTIEVGANYKNKDKNRNEKYGMATSMDNKNNYHAGGSIGNYGASMSTNFENKMEVDVSTPLSYPGAKLELGVSIEDNEDHSEIGGKVAVGQKIGGIGKVKVAGGSKLKIYRPVSLENLLKQLPSTVEEKVYNDFLKDSKLQNLYQTKYEPRTYGGMMETVHYPISEEQLKEAKEKLQNYIEERKEYDIGSNISGKEKKKYFKPCAQ